MELPLTLHRYGAIYGLFLLATSFGAAAAIGRTPGAVSVSQDGEAQYAIPIALPAGTNGMTPTLSLEYGHRTQGGLLGVGWSIGGLSQISRCGQTIAQDGVAARPDGTGNDRFCLDGQRLVIVNHVIYHTPGAEYRTEIESFARIRAVPGTTGVVDHFVVEASDGRIFEYGATSDSRIDGQTTTSSNNARTWALNRIRDRAGNVIDYRYIEDTTNGSFRVSSVHYSGHPASGIAASHQVSFVYENRPNNEVDAGYVAGTPVRQVLRLDRVDVLYDGAVLRRYELNYEPALSAGGRSRLASIQECGGSGPDCLLPTTFEWQDGTPGFAAATSFVGCGRANFCDRRAAFRKHGRHQRGRSRGLRLGRRERARNCDDPLSPRSRKRRLRAGSQFRDSVSAWHRRSVRQQRRWSRRPAQLRVESSVHDPQGQRERARLPAIDGHRHSARHEGFARCRHERRRPRGHRVDGSAGSDGQRPEGPRALRPAGRRFLGASHSLFAMGRRRLRQRRRRGFHRPARTTHRSRR